VHEPHPDGSKSGEDDSSSDDDSNDSGDDLPLSQRIPIETNGRNLVVPTARAPVAPKRTRSPAAKARQAASDVVAATSAYEDAEAFALMELPAEPTAGTKPPPERVSPAGTKRQRKNERKAAPRKPNVPKPQRTGTIRLTEDESVAVRTEPVDDLEHFINIGKRSDETMLSFDNGTEVEVIDGPTNGFYRCRAGDVSGWVRVKKVRVNRTRRKAAAAAEPCELAEPDVPSGGEESDGEESDGGSDEEDAYDVSRIGGERVVEGVKQYLVFWEGWPDSTASWEPAEHLVNCTVLQDYLASS
jgi:hypothetical protein